MGGGKEDAVLGRRRLNTLRNTIGGLAHCRGSECLSFGLDAAIANRVCSAAPLGFAHFGVSTPVLWVLLSGSDTTVRHGTCLGVEWFLL